MKTMTRKTALAALAVAPVFGYLATRKTTETKPATRPIRREPFRAGYFPNVAMQTHEGKTVRFYDNLLKDKIVVINFFYSRCGGLCSPVARNLAQVQKLLGGRVGRDIFIYSISLDPGHDTPAVLREYARNRGIGPGWLLLTGRPEDVELLRRKLGFTDPDPVVDRDKSQHAGIVRYGNEALQRWAACPGEAKPEWIAKSILWMDWPKAMKKGA
ncbi:MAG: SCO family protein [Verrucomicrobia bacterium]|nr:SCO family protein [Verrucomicrobiota bacterium]